MLMAENEQQLQGSGPTKGQGAQRNVHNRFDRYSYEPEDWEVDKEKPQFIEVFPKTIVNQVRSPDLAMDYSANPYQGCEHGCAYCFARPTHEYWGYNAGVDFERKIMVKKNAPQLLEKFLQKKSYEVSPITFSGNTDCYQPIERQLRITRQMLEICRDYRQPVNIITKNALILRDIDILSKMAEQNLVCVSMSIPTLNEELRRRMEPRTSGAAKKLNAITRLTAAGIPVHVMMAPIIPALNSEEILPLFEQMAAAGAQGIGYSLVRLNQSVEPVFVQWLEAHYPDRKEKVLNQIRSMRGGTLGERRFFERYKGEGNIAEMIHTSVKVAKRKFFADRSIPPLNTELFTGSRTQQLRLF